MKRVLGIIGAALLAATPILWLIAAWSPGADSARWGATGIIALFTGAILAAFAILMEPPRGDS